MSDKVTFVNNEGKKVTFSNTIPDCKVDSIEPTTADKRAAACAEAFNIIRTLFSNGVLFSVEIFAHCIVFRFSGSVHILTAQRLLSTHIMKVSQFNPNVVELKLAWVETPFNR